MPGLSLPSQPAAPCAAFPAVPGRVGERGSRTRGAPRRRKRRGWCAGAGGALRGGRSSCCRCHCHRRCHIGFLLYRQPLRSCDRSRAPSLLYAAGCANERARARPRLPQGERVGGRWRLATPLSFRSPPRLQSMRVREGRRRATSNVRRSRPRSESVRGSGTRSAPEGLRSGSGPRARRSCGVSSLAYRGWAPSRASLQ